MGLVRLLILIRHLYLRGQFGADLGMDTRKTCIKEIERMALCHCTF